MHAWENADLNALVQLLTDDAFMSMPPLPHEYEGKEAVLDFSATLFNAGRRVTLIPTRANAQPAFGAYLNAPERSVGAGLYVLTLAGDRIRALTRFDHTVLPHFSLPEHL